VQTEKVIELKKLDSDYWDEMIDGKKNNYPQQHLYALPFGALFIVETFNSKILKPSIKSISFF